VGFDPTESSDGGDDLASFLSGKHVLYAGFQANDRLAVNPPSLCLGPDYAFCLCRPEDQVCQAVRRLILGLWNWGSPACNFSR
jgi:hypothetical protein